jgi:hypothetical protein
MRPVVAEATQKDGDQRKHAGFTATPANTKACFRERHHGSAGTAGAGPVGGQGLIILGKAKKGRQRRFPCPPGRAAEMRIAFGP